MAVTERDIAALRHDGFLLRAALGAGTGEQAEVVIRRMVGAIETLQAEVATLKTQVATLQAASPP